MAKKKLDAVDIAAQQRAREQAEVEQAFLTGVRTLRDFIAPSSIELHSDHFRLGSKYGRTMYVYGYPRQIYTGWLSSIINIDEVLDISMFIYPVDTQIVLNNLRKKVTQLEATMNINMERERCAIQDWKRLYKTPKNCAINCRLAPKSSSATVYILRFTPTVWTN